MSGVIRAARVCNARIGLPDLDGNWPVRRQPAFTATVRRGEALPFGLSSSFPLKLLEYFGGALQRTGARSRSAQALDLFAQRRLVVRQVACKLVDLRDHKAPTPKMTENATRTATMTAGGRGNTSPAQEPDQRCKHEAQKQRERDGISTSRPK